MKLLRDDYPMPELTEHRRDMRRINWITLALVLVALLAVAYNAHRTPPAPTPSVAPAPQPTPKPRAPIIVKTEQGVRT